MNFSDVGLSISGPMRACVDGSTIAFIVHMALVYSGNVWWMTMCTIQTALKSMRIQIGSQ
jgi:hypothetical protein